MNKTEQECFSAAIANMSFAGTRESALFTELPIPPSSNHQYIPVRGRKFAPTMEFSAFKKKMNDYAYTCKDLLEKKHQIQLWLKNKNLLEVRMIFFFHNHRVFTKKGIPKKMDVTNRIKAMHDSISKLLEIDDSYFFRTFEEKAIAHDNLNEMVCLEIMPIV